MATSLEQFELQIGRTLTTKDWRAAGQKRVEQPAALTDLDLAIIGHFGGERDEAAALAARTKALEPPAPTPVESPRGDSTTPAPARAPRPLTRRELLAAFDTYSDAVIKVLHEQRAEITALAERGNDAERTLGELTATVRQLQAQVLDAQATLAARGELTP